MPPIKILYLLNSILFLKLNSIWAQSNERYFSMIKGYNVSTDVSFYMNRTFNDRMDCLTICTSNPRCTLIYMNIDKRLCYFYKMVSIDKFLIPFLSNSQNFVIYRRKFNTGIKQIKFGGSHGGYSQFSANLTLNGNNPLSKIILKCNGFMKQIDFVYSNSQTFSYNIYPTSITSQYTINLIGKEIIYIGHASGEIMDMLEFCVRDLATSDVTCTKGCTQTLSSGQIFDYYEIVSFSGDFNSGFYNSLATFGFQYIGII